MKEEIVPAWRDDATLPLLKPYFTNPLDATRIENKTLKPYLLPSGVYSITISPRSEKVDQDFSFIVPMLESTFMVPL